MKGKKVFKWVGISIGSLLVLGILFLNISPFFVNFSPKYEKGNKYRVEGNTLYFDGKIDEHEFQRFNEYFTPSIDTLVVNSGGGDIRQGLLIAEVLAEHDVRVVVDGICGSSCANYLFVAGKERIIKENSLLAYHGGLNDPTFDYIAGNLFAFPKNFGFLAYLTSTGAFLKVKLSYKGYRQREQEFYKKQGIDIQLILDSREKLEGERYAFWAPDLKQLQSYGFDVSNFWYPKDSKEKEHIKSYVCSRVVEEKKATCPDLVDNRLRFDSL